MSGKTTQGQYWRNVSPPTMTPLLPPISWLIHHLLHYLNSHLLYITKYNVHILCETTTNINISNKYHPVSGKNRNVHAEKRNFSSNDVLSFLSNASIISWKMQWHIFLLLLEPSVPMMLLSKGLKLAFAHSPKRVKPSGWVETIKNYSPGLVSGNFIFEKINLKWLFLTK